jgi:hypothetical protein
LLALSKDADLTDKEIYLNSFNVRMRKKGRRMGMMIRRTIKGIVKEEKSTEDKGRKGMNVRTIRSEK